MVAKNKKYQNSQAKHLKSYPKAVGNLKQKGAKGNLKPKGIAEW